MFTLVLLLVLNGEVLGLEVNSYPNMASCFEARESLMLMFDEPVQDYQSICVKRK